MGYAAAGQHDGVPVRAFCVLSVQRGVVHGHAFLAADVYAPDLSGADGAVFPSVLHVFRRHALFLVRGSAAGGVCECAGDGVVHRGALCDG